MQRSTPFRKVFGSARLAIGAVLIAGVTLAACGGSDAGAPVDSTPEPVYGDGSLVSELSGPTTTLPAPEVMPLTGLPNQQKLDRIGHITPDPRA